MFYILTADLIQNPENLHVDYFYNSAGFGSEVVSVAFMKCIIVQDRLVLTQVIS